MNRRIYKIIPVLLAAFLLLSVSVNVFAAKLKVGSVEGLPEKLVVLDDNGNSVSENGEYYFEVDGMKAGETYTKKIQIMNLREDASYAIWFNAQPLSQTGEINLENECDCDIRMDDMLVYYGKITGEGNPDIRDNALYLGTYHPGDSRVMTVNIKWNGTDKGGDIDNGAKLVDKNGVSVVREYSGKNHIEGETVFKWIFTAAVKDTDTEKSDGPSEISEPSKPTSTVTEHSYNPSSGSGGGGGEESPRGSLPDGGGKQQGIIDFVQTGDTIIYITIAVVAMATLLLIILAIGKRKKQQKKKKE